MDSLYEIHITFKSNMSTSQIQQRLVGQPGKLTHIRLSSGFYSDQPMLTYEIKGNYDDVLINTFDRADHLESIGLEVQRVKVETTPWNKENPQTDEEAIKDQEDIDRYHEMHIKIKHSNRIHNLKQLLKDYDARLSKNPNKHIDNNLLISFVTRRIYKRGQPFVNQYYKEFCDVLKSCPDVIEIIESELEYVVYDDNIATDNGWL